MATDHKKGGETQNMKNKKVLLTALALAGAVTVGGVALTSSVQAASDDATHPLVQQLAERFNLNPDDVEQFMQDHREQRRAERHARMEEHLTEAVTNGTITEAQKQALLAKKEEMRAQHEAIKDLPQDERRDAHRQLREEMKEWAESQGIDLQSLMEDHGGKRKDHGFGKHR
jgi:polyhydroxyalkanoate synthesis regulator phasin